MSGGLRGQSRWWRTGMCERRGVSRLCTARGTDKRASSVRPAGAAMVNRTAHTCCSLGVEFPLRLGQIFPQPPEVFSPALLHRSVSTGRRSGKRDGPASEQAHLNPSLSPRYSLSLFALASSAFLLPSSNSFILPLTPLLYSACSFCRAASDASAVRARWRASSCRRSFRVIWRFKPSISDVSRSLVSFRSSAAPRE